MTLLLLFALATLGLSFFCSVLEAVLLSVTPGYVASMQQRRPRTGHALHGLKHDIDRPLAAILTLNTIANTAGAAAVGAQAHVVFGSTSLMMVSAILTLGVLFLSEIIPKTIGAVYWRTLAPAAAWLMEVLIVAMYPVVLVANAVTYRLAKGRKRVGVSREEFRALADLGHREGLLRKDESRLLKNVLRFSSLAVRDVMTPRTVVLAVDQDLTIAEANDANPDLRFSRIPIYRDNVDHITGYVRKGELLLKLAEGQHQVRLAELRRDIVVEPDTLLLHQMFERLLRGSEQVAALVDQYGGTAGILTMEDIVETLLGLEIVDETDTDRDMQKLARKLWARRAREVGIVLPDSQLPGKDPHQPLAPSSGRRSSRLVGRITAFLQKRSR